MLAGGLTALRFSHALSEAKRANGAQTNATGETLQATSGVIRRGDMGCRLWEGTDRKSVETKGAILENGGPSG